MRVAAASKHEAGRQPQASAPGQTNDKRWVNMGNMGKHLRRLGKQTVGFTFIFPQKP
jgi:hypothetical protein